MSKGQTLTYINGYQRENALREVKDMPAAATAALDATAGTGTFSPTRTTTFEDSPGKLPQWVENDRKVRRGPQGACRRHAGSTCMPPPPHMHAP